MCFKLPCEIVALASSGVSLQHKRVIACAKVGVRWVFYCLSFRIGQP